MSEAIEVTPLFHRAPVGAGEDSLVAMTEIVGWGIIELRIRPEDQSAHEAVRAVLGFELPCAARSSSGIGELKALWLSVDQWLIIGRLVECGARIEALKAALNGHLSSVTDLSSAYAMIRLAGAGANEIIKKGSQCNFAGNSPVAGTVSRLPLAGLPAIVHMVQSGGEMIDLYVDRSYAESAWAWLVRASRRQAEVRLFARQSTPPV